jgi:WD40 repeat protein/tRNA A-37 threonylcarbamoyl transferase component Bud32
MKIDHERVEALLNQALDLEPEGRNAFLMSACGDDHTLRHQVETLLSVADESQGFLPDAPTRSAGPPSEAPGTHIGRYKLLQKIGEGGFGVVYVAEQREPVKRRVALKIIKLGMDTRQVVARFEAERQALALMDHPNIAKVLDAGATDTGRPYFVMELVRGVPITQYCDENRLTTGERLDPFMAVCLAVQHAHQKGIIHRDIKPSNILVTLHDGAPVPKVIDFGIAKATQQELTEKTIFTQFRQMIGTPAYMSPEQAEMSGLDIDTRTDIYSLGVLLYELLTGSTPFDTKELLQSGLDEMRKIIREREPLRPSTRLTQLQANPKSHIANHKSKIENDLDWIVMKALEKDRTRRYDTAKGLVNDLRRYLNHEPVEAAAPSPVYRCRKFVRRHRTSLAVTAALTGLLVTGTLISAWLAIRATAAQEKERIAREEAETAEGRAASALGVSRRMEAELALDKAQLLGEQGDANVALLWLARSLTVAPQDAEDLRRVIRAALGAWQRHVSPLRLVLPHPGRVDRIAFTADGERFLTAARIENRGVVLQRWDARDGRLIGEPFEHLGGMVYSLAFSPDAKHLALGYTDGDFELMDCESGDVQALRLSPDTGAITAIAFNPDSSVILIASSLSKPTNIPSPEDLDESSATVLSGSRTIVQLIRNRTAEPLLDRPLEFEQSIWAAAFSPDGHTFVTGIGPWVTPRQTGYLRFWNLGGEEVRDALESSSPPMCVVWSPDGSKLLTGHAEFCGRVWDLKSGQLATEVSSTAPVGSVHFDPVDGRTFLTGSYGGTVRLWDTSTGGAISPPLWHQYLVRSAIFSPDGRRILSGSRGAVRLHDVPSSVLDRTPPPLEPGLIPIALDGDGIALVTDKENNVQLRRTDDHASIGSPIVHPSRVLTGAFSKDLRLVATVGIDHVVRAWESSSGRMLTELPAREPGYCVTFSPDSRVLVSGHFGAIAMRWDTESWELIDTLAHQLHSGPVLSVQYSGDGERVLTGGADGMARLWDAGSGRPLGSIRHSTAVIAGFSPDSTIIITAGTDHNVRLWDPSTHQTIGRPMAHQGFVFSAKFSRDGQTVFTACADQTARLWDVQTGKQIGPSWRHSQRVIDADFWPDGRTLATFTGQMDPLHSPVQAVAYWTIPSPLVGTDEEVELWAQVATGTELESNGGVRVTDTAAWQEQYQRLRNTDFRWPYQSGAR